VTVIIPASQELDNITVVIFEDTTKDFLNNHLLMYRNDDIEQSNHNTTHKITVTNVLVVDQYLQQQRRRRQAANVRSLQKEEETLINNSTTSSTTTTTTLTVQMIVQAIIDPGGGDVMNFSLADILDSTFERNKQTYENELAEALGTDMFVSAVEQGTTNNNSQKRVVPIGVVISVTLIGLIILAIGLLLARRYSINMASSRPRDQQQQQQDLHVQSWSSAASDIIIIISPNNDQKNDNGNDSLITQRPAISPVMIDPSPPSIPASPVSLGDGRPRYSVAFAPSGLSLLDADTDTDEENNPYTQQLSMDPSSVSRLSEASYSGGDHHQLISIDSMASGIVSVLGARLSPIAEDIQARMEDCDLCTPRNGRYASTINTPRGTEFIQLDFNVIKLGSGHCLDETPKNAIQSNDLLADLEDMEKKWEGQLDSMVTPETSTPRQNNLEKYNKGGRDYYTSTSLCSEI